MTWTAEELEDILYRPKLVRPYDVGGILWRRLEKLMREEALVGGLKELSTYLSPLVPYIDRPALDRLTPNLEGPEARARADNLAHPDG